MRGTPPPQKTAEQMLIDRIKSLEMDMRESSELNEHLRERIKRLEEAGDAIVDHNIGCGCGQDGPCRACRMACEAWNKAKEAKP